MKELGEAVLQKKRVVLLVETDPGHGGIPMSVHEEQCVTTPH